MRDNPNCQAGSGIRFDWGATGARQLTTAAPDGCLVVVDVLSFSTAVTVAVSRGSSVYPFPWRDDERARQFADEHGAALAVGRRAAGGSHPWSLSPHALRTAPAVPRLVLPSPNGSAIAAAASGPVVAACLTNARAAAGWLIDQGYGSERRPVHVVAAGEHWPDGTLRPALEDLLGAGAVIRVLLGAAIGSGSGLASAEARAAAAVHAGTPDVTAAILDCASGRELARAGFVSDVRIAAEQDTTLVVPVLVDGAFRAG